MLDDEKTKTCMGPCGESLPADAAFFGRKSACEDGLDTQCKACRYEARRNSPHQVLKRSRFIDPELHRRRLAGLA